MKTFYSLALAHALMFVAPLVSWADDIPTPTVKNRAGFFPSRKHVPLNAKAVGILLADGQAILSTEGRSGPPDQLVLSTDGNSYRWLYVQADSNPQITNLQVPIGENGKQKQVYPALHMASLRWMSKWGIARPFTLVEIEVNGGQGSPANDSFVATNVRVLEGTKEFPLKTADAIKDAKDRYAALIARKQAVLDRMMKETGEKALAGKPATGPREKSDLMYVTWHVESSTLRIHFKTTLSDGAYALVGGGANPRPFPLPPPPLPPNKGGLLRAAPPRDMKIKTGTTFGLEFGQVYVVNKDGKVVGTEELAVETFIRQLNNPPRPGFQPRPGLPVPPAPPKVDLE